MKVYQQVYSIFLLSLAAAGCVTLSVTLLAAKWIADSLSKAVLVFVLAQNMYDVLK